MTRPSLLIAAGAAIALAVPALPALAQDDLSPAAPTPPPMEMDVGEVTDVEIAQFANALQRVDQIMVELVDEMQTMDPQQQAQAQQDVQPELAEAVESEGLSVDRYNQIAIAAQTDPDLANRIVSQQ